MESLPICRHTGASDPHRTHTGTQTPPRRHTQPQTRRTHILTNNLHVLPKNSKSTDPISSLNTHGPTGTNTPTLISQGLSAWLMGEARPGLAGPLPVHTGLYPYSASPARLPQWPWLWPWLWLPLLPLQLLRRRLPAE